MYFCCVVFLFFNVCWDFADVPFEIEAFSFFSKSRPAVVQETYLSAIAKRVLFGVKGPHYLPHVSAVLRNIFQNIFSLQY